MHSFIRALIMSGVFLAMAAAAQATPTVIQNGYIHAGVSDYGTLGSGDHTEPGIIYDSTGTGTNLYNDFLTPGRVFEAFYVTGDGGRLHSGANADGTTSFSTGSPVSLSPTKATWTGTDGTVQITNSYSLETIAGRPVISMTTDITNLTGSTIAGLNFLRAIDPDPDAASYGYCCFDTNNRILSPDQACSDGLMTHATICLGTDSAIVHGVGFTDVSEAYEDPALYLAGHDADGPYGYGDFNLGLAFDIGDLAAGASKEISYFYSFGPSPEDAALPIPLPAADSVPEPWTPALLASALLGLAGLRRRQFGQAR